MNNIIEAVKGFLGLSEVQYALDAVVKMVLAIIFSGFIGYEREHSHRPAGFRTHILVAVGSALVMMTSRSEYRLLLRHHQSKPLFCLLRQEPD